MKKAVVLSLVSMMMILSAGRPRAQMMGNFSKATVDWNEVVEHTNREEQEGKELWGKFQAKETACENLDDEQFGVLGEYFMGQMMGEAHAAMNAMMMQMHGEEGEEQIHVVMGKRFSGCEPTAAFPLVNGAWMPMMGMMGQGGRWLSPANSSLGSFGGIFMILWWVLVIVGVVAIIKWLVGQAHGPLREERSSLEILKERYARGEIAKKEFEEKKRDLK